MNVMTLCQGCGRQGLSPFGGDDRKPRWCKCKVKKGFTAGGPYVMAPGHVVALIFETKEDAAFREKCRLAGNAEREARDRLSERWVRCGRGWRELPRGNAKRERLEREYVSALRALNALRRVCSHPERSIFAEEFCGICYEHVESDVAQHRHLVRVGFFKRVSAADRRAAFAERGAA